MKASTDPINKWFFTDGSFSSDLSIERNPNTWLNDNFVIISEKKILAYFESHWNKSLNIITSVRLIFFDKNKTATIMNALFDLAEYIFCTRGCKALNWTVAEKNYHAYRIYEKFIKKYFGHKIGKRHNGQMAYNSEISDIYLYEITSDEYFKWKKSNPENGFLNL